MNQLKDLVIEADMDIFDFSIKKAEVFMEDGEFRKSSYHPGAGGANRQSSFLFKKSTSSKDDKK